VAENGEIGAFLKLFIMLKLVGECKLDKPDKELALNT